MYEFKQQTENVSISLALARLLASSYGKNDAVFSTVWIENEFSVSSSTGGPSEFLMADHFFPFIILFRADTNKHKFKNFSFSPYRKENGPSPPISR